MEILKGLGILNASFLVPVIVVFLIILIIAKVAKNLLKLGILIAVIAIGVVIYFNLPSFTVDNSTATLKLMGQEHTISAKTAKVITEDKDGKKQTVLVSGTERIVLPFSKDFAEKFIMEKLKNSK
ncbi:hypothetical protein [Clostridium sp. BNL1100]|uniref:hypothetical protein n=1 Tax=Clostridium sp. BNL1100 TaxID=755731 RepID=UPI00024A7B36|nr:hypothetical protein [Clostridium sp. BNL1100]AEY64896.1 hypothetical protein Clo1100_0623 [Clostridium sp. BNL1100]